MEHITDICHMQCQRKIIENPNKFVFYNPQPRKLESIITLLFVYVKYILE